MIRLEHNQIPAPVNRFDGEEIRPGINTRLP